MKSAREELTIEMWIKDTRATNEVFQSVIMENNSGWNARTRISLNGIDSDRRELKV